MKYFFRDGQLKKIVANVHKILREQQIGKSKLDFKIKNTYVEVKMPLMHLPGIAPNTTLSQRKVITFERFVRHVAELDSLLQITEKAIMIYVLCIMLLFFRFRQLMKGIKLSLILYLTL